MAWHARNNNGLLARFLALPLDNRLVLLAAHHHHMVSQGDSFSLFFFHFFLTTARSRGTGCWKEWRHVSFLSKVSSFDVFVGWLAGLLGLLNVHGFGLIHMDGQLGLDLDAQGSRLLWDDGRSKHFKDRLGWTASSRMMVRSDFIEIIMSIRN